MATTKRKPTKQARAARTLKKDWKAPFVELLRDFGHVSACAEACGVSQSTVYKYRKDDPKFRASWDEALETLYDSLEAELIRRGRDGAIEPVYYKGVIVGQVTKFDTTAALSVLNARCKNRGYGREVKIMGDPDAPIQITTIVTDRKRPTMADLKNGARKNGVPAELPEGKGE